MTAPNSSFERIYQDHVELVYNLSLNYLHNSHEAEEATQDVFVKVYQKLHSFDKRSTLKTWIYRMTVNTCLDRIKASKRKKRFGFMSSILELKQEPTNLTEFNHPGVALESKEGIGRIMKCINQLPESQRTALILKAIEDLPVKEIAKIMDKSDKSVESLLARAKAKLKSLLASSEGN